MQDIRIDASPQVLPEHERGTANGFLFGVVSGAAIGGSGAIFIAGKFGFGVGPVVCAMIP